MADERKELDWDLSVNVPVKGITRKLRVTSNESVQAIILKVASKLGKISNTTMYIRECVTINRSELHAIKSYIIHNLHNL